MSLNILKLTAKLTLKIMKKLIAPNPNLSLDALKQKIEKAISNSLYNLNSYNSTDRQKQLEICQFGKMLATYFPDFFIDEVREKPDFIISDGKKRIAVEHQTIVNPIIKSKQGFYENIFQLVERDLQTDNSLPNFLAVCYLKSNLKFKNTDKQLISNLIKETVKEFVLNGILVENPLIMKIIKMPNSHKNLHANFGAFMRYKVDAKILKDFILKKENKVQTYRQNTEMEQWLLLVTGGVAEYWYEVEIPIENLDLKSSFDKIFLMSDFDNILYELK